MNRVLRIAGGVVITLIVFLCSCSGGGADISNPFTGTVSLASNDGEAVFGARVVLARTGADPGHPQRITEGFVAAPDKSIELYTEAIFFDTTYTDEYGMFTFEEVASGGYTVTASYNGQYAITRYVWNVYSTDAVVLLLSDPAAVHIQPYEPLDTANNVYFYGARIAGTEYVALSNAAGEVTLPKVPSGVLDLVLYRSDMKKTHYSALRTISGSVAELYMLPSIDTAQWTAHHSGPRMAADHPYVLSSTGTEGAEVTLLESGKTFDIRIQFSCSMDALSTTMALSAYSDSDSVEIDDVRWVGGNVLYISLCVSDGAGACLPLQEGVSTGDAGVIIATTAQSVDGVPLAYKAIISVHDNK